MSKALFLAAGLILAASPALAQSSGYSDDRDRQTASDRGDRDRDRGWHRDWRMYDDDDHDRSRGGARFMIRSGDSTVAVRCDESESMRSCVDNTLTLLERVRSLPPAPSRTPGTTPPPEGQR